MAELTDKQKRFVQEYMRDSCATKAAVRAGFSERAASEIGYQLLQKTSVLAAIQSLQDEIEQQLRMQFVQDAIKAREVLREIMDNPNATNKDRITAAKDLLDRAGFKAIDKKEISGPANGSIEIVFVNP
ncbi:terminase small subunit [Neobacillus sp. NPDC093182]|uniref:terminase small subunit n=1 Tax=Neobacillus sp. NPDC093182 TaxID=3364297 RepID=UPI0038275BE8